MYRDSRFGQLPTQHARFHQPEPSPLPPVSASVPHKEEVPQFTKEEVERLKKVLEVLEAVERVAWLWRNLKLWVGYIVATIVGTYVVWDHIGKILQKSIK